MHQIPLLKGFRADDYVIIKFSPLFFPIPSFLPFSSSFNSPRSELGAANATEAMIRAELTEEDRSGLDEAKDKWYKSMDTFRWGTQSSST